jgi:hypothetical protein
MNTQLAERNNYSMVEKVVIEGDLSQLSPQERVTYYRQVCDSVGLNPLTKPFEYIRLNSKLTLYAKRDATDQLRKIHVISIEIKSREVVEDCYVVTAQAKDKEGRTDEAIGAVNIANLKGEARANAMMKAETKAKRRVTLSIAGMGFLDETEISSIAGADSVLVDQETGEIKGKITGDTIDQAKVFKAVVWFKEIIDADNIEVYHQKVKDAWERLTNDERSAVHEQLQDKASSSKRAYKNILKLYLDHVPEESIPEGVRE